jgi:hypothetical protein
VLLRKARRLLVFADDAQQSNAWVLDFGAIRLTLALSAEVWRGFSGEGQALWALMRADGAGIAKTINRVRAQLQWQAALDPAELASNLLVDRSLINDTLRVIGASGLAGYDLMQAAYFHRVLPFDLTMVEELHPRLVDAKALIDARAVNVITNSPFEAAVASRDTVHRVREVEGTLHCTCPWFAKHQGARGPCKHALAAAALRTFE